MAAALATAGHASSLAAQQQLLDGVHTSFMTGFHIACIVAAVICLALGSVALLLPGRTRRGVDEAQPTEAELVPA